MYSSLATENTLKAAIQRSESQMPSGKVATIFA